MGLFLCAARGQESGMQSGTLLADHGIAFNRATGKVYAVDQEHGAVMVIDGRTGVAKRVTVGTHPVCVAVNAATGRVYVANGGNGNVSVLDGATDQVVATVKTDRRPYYVGVNEATNKAFVSNTFSSVMTIIDGATNTSRQLPVGSGDALIVDGKSDKIYLLGYEDPNLRVIDGTTGATTREPVGSVHAWAPAIDSERRVLYVTRSGTADILALGMDTHEHKVIKVGNIPSAVAVDAATHRVYVANYADDTVSVIDGGRVIATLKVGRSPQSIAVDAKRRRIYVANFHGDSVTVIDSANNRVLATKPAGRNPYAVVVDEAAGTVFVGNMTRPSSEGASVFTKVELGR
ncbi:YncE family protein [Terriglobus saanensis]